MIALDVDSYCQTCKEFVPHTVTYDLGCDDINTVVTCEHKKQCKNMFDSIKKNIASINYLDCENGAAGEYVRGWNDAIDAMVCGRCGI